MAQFTAEQIDTARQIMAEANREGIPTTGNVRLALMEAGLVESGMRNLTYGDRDSRGVFQERPSQGWHDVNNIPSATQQILARMVKAPNQSDAGAIAQYAESSGYPDRYNQHFGEAQNLLLAIGDPGVGVAPGGGDGAGAPGAAAPPVPGAVGVGVATGLIGQYGMRLGFLLFGAVITFVGVYLLFGHHPAGVPVLGAIANQSPAASRSPRSSGPTRGSGAARTVQTTQGSE